jgi:two-component system alkaline phosphatase synthesis response regulator PhoP
MSDKILIVDDEPGITDLVGRALRQQGYKTICAADGDEALNMIFEELPDMVILDLMLPKMDGWEVCRRVKSDKKTKNIPVLMLTARNSAEDVVQGLDLGADDYMRKPFPLAELLARIRVLLRRNITEDANKLINGDLVVDFENNEVFLRGNILDLSPTEFDILSLLAKRIGHVVSRDELLKKIWGVNNGDTRTVDVHISRLRKKMDDGALPALITKTLRGRGYKLVWEEDGECPKQ